MTANFNNLKLFKAYQEQGLKLWEETIYEFKNKVNLWHFNHPRKLGNNLPDILKIYTDKLEDEYRIFLFEFMKHKCNNEYDYTNRFEDINKVLALLRKTNTVNLNDISDEFRPIAEMCLGIQFEITMCIPEDLQ